MRTRLLALAALASFFAPRPADAQELHRERFAESTISFQGKVQDCYCEDFDYDGKRDLLVTHQSFSREGSKSPIRYISLKYQRPGGDIGGKPDQTWIVPAEASALVFGDYTEAPGREIGYYSDSGLYVWEKVGNAYDLDAKPLILAETFFDVPQDDSLPLAWWPFDLDSNGLSDVLVPLHGSYRLYLQTKPGVYGLSFPLSMQVASKAEEAGSAFLRIVKALPRVDLQDVNGDFRTDVCLLWQDQFIFYLQGSEGEGANAHPTFPEKPSGQMQLVFLRQREQKNKIATSITYLHDVNHGGGVDFVASYTRGELSKVDAIATDYYMYLGTGGKDILATAPAWRISLPGISYNPGMDDLNGDGFDDLIVSNYETGMASNAGKLVFQNVPVNYYAYLFNPQKQSFSVEYDWKETISVNLDKISGGAGMPQLRFGGDWDGDGRRDILRQDGEGWISAARGISVKTLLRNAPVDFEKTDIFKVNVFDKDSDGKPDPPRGLGIWEMNGDGKSDILLSWNGRLKFLISK